MANEIRLRNNNISGTITDNPLAIGATTINSAGFADLPVVGATNHMLLILDPLEVGGTAEIVMVTAHTASATSVTVLRGQEGSLARSHVFNTTWFHGPVASDFVPSLPADLSGQWPDFTPSVDQGATLNIAKTVTYSRYVKMGRTVIFTFHLTITGTGTVTSSISVSLPFTANAALGAVFGNVAGSFLVFDTSANTFYTGAPKISTTAVFATPTTTIGVGSQNLGLGSSAGTTLMSAALANGDIITGAVIYEASS